MMTTTKIKAPKAINREFYLSDDDRATLEEYAAAGGTNPSSVVRMIIEEICSDRDLSKVLADVDLDTIAARDMGRMAVRMTEELWTRFETAAWKVRSTRSKMLRAYILTQVPAKIAEL